MRTCQAKNLTRNAKHRDLILLAPAFCVFPPSPSTSFWGRSGPKRRGSGFSTAYGCPKAGTLRRNIDEMWGDDPTESSFHGGPRGSIRPVWGFMGCTSQPPIPRIVYVDAMPQLLAFPIHSSLSLFSALAVHLLPILTGYPGVWPGAEAPSEHTVYRPPTRALHTGTHFVQPPRW